MTSYAVWFVEETIADAEIYDDMSTVDQAVHQFLTEYVDTPEEDSRVCVAAVVNGKPDSSKEMRFEFTAKASISFTFHPITPHLLETK